MYIDPENNDVAPPESQSRNIATEMNYDFLGLSLTDLNHPDNIKHWLSTFLLSDYSIENYST